MYLPSAGAVGPDLLRNYCRNPSFEVDLSLWAEQDTDASMTPTRDTTQMFSGIASLKLVNTGAGGDDYLALNMPNVVTSGATYVFSAYLRAPTVTAGALGNRGLWGVAGVTGALDSSTQVYTTLTAAQQSTSWVRHQIIVTPLPGHTDLWVSLYGPQGTVFWDAVQVEKGGGQASTYFDGSLSGSSWLGTAHASVSQSNSLSSGSVAPGFASGWEHTAAADRKRCSPTKGTSPLVTKQVQGNNVAGHDTLVRQYVSDPIDAQTITGTVEGVIRALENETSADIRAQMIVRVVSGDGALVRGTLLNFDTGSLSSEWPSGSLTNRYFPKGSTGATVTSVAALAGDRIAIEIGYRQHTTVTISTRDGGSSEYPKGSLSFGEPGTDCAQNETSTTANAPWVEFSFTIAFQAGGTPTPGPDPSALGTVVGVPRKTIPWKIFLCDLNGEELQDVTGIAQGKRVSKRLMRPAMFAAAVPSDNAKVRALHTDGYPFLHPLNRVVKGYRKEGSSYVLRYAGTVETLEDVGEHGALTGFTAFDPLHNCAHRLVRDELGSAKLVVFNGDEIGSIVQAVVNRANAKGSSQLTTDGGTFEATGTRQVRWEYKYITPALLEICQADNGADFVVEPVERTDGYLAQISVYVAFGRDLADVVLSWDEEPATARRVSNVQDGSQFANVVISLGATQTGGDQLINTQQDLSVPYRMREAVSSRTDVATPSYLQSLGAEELRVRKVIPRRVLLTTVHGKVAEPWSHFYLGDTIRSRASTKLRGGFSGVQRVYGFDVDLDGGEQLAGVLVAPE